MAMQRHIPEILKASLSQERHLYLKERHSGSGTGQDLWKDENNFFSFSDLSISYFVELTNGYNPVLIRITERQRSLHYLVIQGCSGHHFLTNSDALFGFLTALLYRDYPTSPNHF